MKLDVRFTHSLEKVFPDGRTMTAPLGRPTVLRGERFSCQLAMRNETPGGGPPERSPQGGQLVLKVELACPFAVEVRRVRPVPVEIPSNYRSGDLLRCDPGLYPDCLEPLAESCFRLPGGQSGALWFTVEIPRDCAGGIYRLGVSLENREHDRRPRAERESLELSCEFEVIEAAGAPRKLLRYEWLHVDCLASVYHVETWSAEHWRIIENFIRNGARHGLNVLYTPLWTPPLDTRRGGERPTTQLLDIRRGPAGYEFDFTRLERYLDLGLACGITHFGMSHLFTQWGAEATPKIMVEEAGELRRAFGWDEPADSPGYAAFLTALLPLLCTLLRQKGLAHKVFFSVSDEPNIRHLDNYRRAVNLVEPLVGGDFDILDALSNYDFYETGLVKLPVPANNHIESFAGKVPRLFTYHCVSQELDVPNRFIAMPSLRNRVLGVLFYLYRVEGFLQWGFNFYYTQYSLAAVDPFADCCAGCWTPGGDAFIVYPGPEGKPWDSLRHEVFYEALQDFDALRALEEKIGREKTEAVIHENLEHKLSMTVYPRDARWLLSLRDRVNRLLATL